MSYSSSLEEFLDDAERQRAYLFVKRLAANDTLATGAHQAGSYVPKAVAFDLFPSLEKSPEGNPRVEFDAEVVSHGDSVRVVNIIWYNNKTRDECHITRWGGASSPVLDPESTGSLCLLAFLGETERDATHCRVWLCSNPAQEDEFERRFDVIEPGAPQSFDFRSGSQIRRQAEFEYSLPKENLELWNRWDQGAEFPTGKELIDFVVLHHPETADLPIDKRLVRRRELEYIEFRRLEKAVVLPRVLDGFGGVDEFVDYANSVTNRRKSRSGKSLELHMVRILNEEGIHGFAHDKVTEGNKRPDFLFPSMDAYSDPEFCSDKLRMLACKTTCKDRWRQVIDEAPRIAVKHLLTLQEGVSENQFAQMEQAGIKLVVPKGLHKSFPGSIRNKLLSVDEFIALVRNIGN